MVTRGFVGKKREQGPRDPTERVPPGQHLVNDFPVLTAGPTPRIATEDWVFTLKIGPRPVKKWTWREFNDLPMTRVVRDIHCVTTWSKLDTQWEGVMVDEILADAGIEPPTGFMLAHSFDGYSTNVPVADLVGGKAWSRRNSEDSPSRPIMAVRPVCWCRTSISGSPRNG